MSVVTTPVGLGRAAFYTEADVASTLTLDSVVDAMDAMLRAQARGTAQNLAKTMAVWQPSSSAHALGAVDVDAGLVAFKTWVNTPGGAAATVTVHDSQDGSLVAVMSAGTLGSLRTAAVNAVATRYLSDPAADELAIIGTGRQAMFQVRAIQEVRPLRRVRVWSRDPARAEQFANQIVTDLAIDAVPTASVADAVRDVPVVTLISRSTEPILGAHDLAPGAHLNAAGAILPANAEFDPALLGGARLTVVDDLVNARRASRELREFYQDDWSPVQTLADVVSAAAGPPPGSGPTVFKPLGMGLSDLAAVTAFLKIVQPERWSTT